MDLDRSWKSTWNLKCILVLQAFIHKFNQHFWLGQICYVITCSFPTPSRISSVSMHKSGVICELIDIFWMPVLDGKLDRKIYFSRSAVNKNNRLMDLSIAEKVIMMFWRYTFSNFRLSLHKKMRFSIKDFFSKCDLIQLETADLVTYAEEILNGRLQFLGIVYMCIFSIPELRNTTDCQYFHLKKSREIINHARHPWVFHQQIYWVVEHYSERKCEY